MDNKTLPPYFNTLAEALDQAVAGALDQSVEFDTQELERFVTNFGPVNYGKTVRGALQLFKYRGKLNYTRALTVVVYRTESGRYELTSYIN